MVVASEMGSSLIRTAAWMQLAKCDQITKITTLLQGDIFVVFM